MTDRERVIVMAYTGVCMFKGDRLRVFYKYLEELMGRPVYTHELADHGMWDEIKKLSEPDFLELCAE